MVYAVNEEFSVNSCKHCAPMFIVKQNLKIAPTSDDLSATVTFIKFQGRTFGITCRHVVMTLRKKIIDSGNAYSHTFFIALNEHRVVQDRFIIPPEDWCTPEPDIAIRELNRDLPEILGKVALDIEANPVPTLPEVTFAVAVGFPDRLKTQTNTSLGYQLSMPCVHAIADNQSIAGSSFTLFSELPAAPEIRDLSGMSGGPIYWCNEAAYGLLGITYESSPVDGAISGSASVHIKGHLADRETIERWLSAVPKLY